MSKNTTIYKNIKYSAHAHFYNLIDGNEKIECRRSSYIMREGYEDRDHDALVIMMNPGSSAPESDDDVEVYSHINISKLYNRERLSKAGIDGTMHVVKRLMHLQKWGKIKIINLSDYRNPDSADFYKFLINNTEVAHYLMHPARQQDLNREIEKSVGKKVIFAWGVEHASQPYTEPFLSAFKHGVGVKNSEGLFCHPMGKRPNELWVNEMNELLTNQ